MYSDLKNHIKPFDLIAFRGGDVISDLIAILEKYEVGADTFTHVGIVVTSEILPNQNLDPDKLYILESTFAYQIPLIYDNKPDVITGRGHFGVILRDLEEIINWYICNDKTKVAWCKLLNNPVINNDLITKFEQFFDSYHNRTYDMDLLGLFGAIFPQIRGLRDLQDKLLNKMFKRIKGKDFPAWQFCSELVANAYQLIGVIDQKFDSKNVLPIDFFGYDRDGIPKLVCEPIYFNKF